MKGLKLFIIISVSIAALFILGLFLISPKINVADNIETKVGSNYTIDYKASYLFKDVTDDIKIDGNVNTNTLGIYSLTLSLHEGPFNIKKVVTVNVLDKEEPVITLIGENNYDVCSLDNFEEPGYTAKDNYDGDITDKVKVFKEDNRIVYQVEDSSHNKTEMVRSISINDNEKPKINLNGKQEMSINKGVTYQEPGYTATDNCDGDITDKVKVEGTVDTSTLGDYKINYKVSDKNNNEATITRTVHVVEKGANSGVIYLTFDDGPGSYTNDILDTLKKYNIKATFFVTNAGSDEVLKREYDEGHTIGLHTASHNYKYIYASVDNFFSDLNIIKDRVIRVTGVTPKYTRFPGGSSIGSNKKAIVDELLNQGYTYFDWNVCIEDAGSCAYNSNPQNCIFNYYRNQLRYNGENVVLMHDIKSYTARKLAEMIEYGLNEGFTFKAIDDNTPTFHLKKFN